MAENSNIEWTDHTFNPWRGCQKVSDGCKNCFAETLSKRNPATLGEWGPNGKRAMAAESYWKLPFKWNSEAEATGVRRRVFCASLADVFEDNAQVLDARVRLFDLIRYTPALDWLLLTKRPQNILPHIKEVYEWWHTEKALDYQPATVVNSSVWLDDWLQGNPPHNVWLGTSVENQEAADERIAHLLSVPATIRFLSCEPLLGPVGLEPYLYGRIHGMCVHCSPLRACELHGRQIDWVIVGGESGPKARPMHPDWVRSLRDQCEYSRVAFFFKQWGEWLPFEEDAQPPFWNDQAGGFYDGHGLDILDPETGDVGAGWHPDSINAGCAWKRAGKHKAGRLLDGRTWDELPEVARES